MISKAEYANIPPSKAEYANIPPSQVEYANIPPSQVPCAKTGYWHTQLDLIQNKTYSLIKIFILYLIFNSSDLYINTTAQTTPYPIA